MTAIMRRRKLQDKEHEKMPFQQIVKYMIERTRLHIYAFGGRMGSSSRLSLSDNFSPVFDTSSVLCRTSSCNLIILGISNQYGT